MHGHIGEMRRGAQSGGDLDFYYRTRAALLEARGFGNDSIDYDYYRARARTHRRRVRHAFFESLMRFIRPLFAVALIAAALSVMPTTPQDCAICGGSQTAAAAR